MQLELTEGTNVTFYNPNPMSVLVQNFDQHEQKIFKLIIYELKQYQHKWVDDTFVDRQVTIEINDVRSKIGNPNSNDFKSAISKLLGKVYLSFNNEYDSFVGRPYFSEISYSGKNGRTGSLTVTINPKLNEAWLNLTHGFTPQYLDKCLKIKGKYAPALYDFICKYNQPKIISWYDLRIYLDIKGTDYIDWQAFKKGVLARSKQQIERNTVRTFHFKVVAGERNDEMKGKKIKIWGGLNEKFIPNNDRKIVLDLIKKLGYNENRQKDYILEYIYEHHEAFIEAYNEVRRAPKYQKVLTPEGWKEVGSEVRKRLKIL